MKVTWIVHGGGMSIAVDVRLNLAITIPYPPSSVGNICVIFGPNSLIFGNAPDANIDEFLFIMLL